MATAVVYKCSCLMDLVHAVYGSSVMSLDGECRSTCFIILHEGHLCCLM